MNFSIAMSSLSIESPVILESTPSLCSRFWKATCRVITLLPTSLATIPATMIGLTQGVMPEPGQGGIMDSSTVTACGWAVVIVIAIRQISDVVFRSQINRVQAIAERELSGVPSNSSVQEEYNQELSGKDLVISPFNCVPSIYVLSAISEVPLGFVFWVGLCGFPTVGNGLVTVVIPAGFIIDIIQLTTRIKKVAKLNSNIVLG